jgi:hypothetical protein
MSNEQLTRLPPPVIDWQSRAEKAEATLARVREVAEKQAALDVSNGSWKMATRKAGQATLRALEGK